MTHYDEALHAIRDAQIAHFGCASASIEARLIERGHILTNDNYEHDRQEAEE